MIDQPVDQAKETSSSTSAVGCTQEAAALAMGGLDHPTAAKLSLEIAERLFGRSVVRDFAVRLWDGQEWRSDPGRPPRFTIILNHPGALRRMLLPPSELGLGESFVRGDFDVEGDLVACIGLADAVQATVANPTRWPGILRRLLALPQTTVAAGRWRGEARLSGDVHSPGRDRQAVTYHYDLPGEFYALFLDQRMQYSCAYFRHADDSLDVAQEAKLEHICRKLRLKPGERLLDIGCGWGGLVAYAAERHGVQALGITISQGQAYLGRRRLAAAGLNDRARVDLCDYRSLDEWEGFDKIVSVGMFEHVGRKKLQVYFDQAYRLLKPGGLFLNHGIAGMYLPRPGPVAGLIQRTLYAKGSFIGHYVFPDGELEPINESLACAERAGFEVRDVESLREHYALTLRHWLRNLEQRREEALAIVDVPTYRVWRLFTAGCAYFFDTARLNVYQALLVKPDHSGKSHLPLTREYLYVG